MLGGDDYCFNAFGLAVVGVLYGDLAFGVGTEIGHQFPLFADFGEFLKEHVREGDGERHELGGFAAGVAEHHSLIASSLLFFLGAFDSLVDVGRLFVDGGDDSAGVGFEFVFAFGVADVGDDVADGFLDVDVGFGFDFAAYDDESGGDESFAGDFRCGVLTEEFVEECVGDLVGDFVGVSFGHGF